MEKKFYHTDFEELIKEKADQYKMYPSDRVWKGIDRAIRSRRKWYWSGFVLLLSGISYLAITELISPAAVVPAEKSITPIQQPEVTAQQLNPFTIPVITHNAPSVTPSTDEVTSDFSLEEDGNVTAAFEIPLKLLPGTVNANADQKASVRISGLAPLSNHEQYNFELSWPDETGKMITSAVPSVSEQNEKIVLHPQAQEKDRKSTRLNSSH